MTFGRKGVAAGAAPERPASVRKFRLNTRKGKLLLAGGFCAAAAAFFAVRALTNDRGVVIQRLIELDSGGASVFYAVLAAISLVGLGIAAMAIVRQFGEPQWLVLDGHAVSGPQSVVMSRQVRIPYADLVNIKRMKFGNSSAAELRGRGGQKIWLGTDAFERDEDFDEFFTELDRRVVAARGVQSGRER